MKYVHVSVVGEKKITCASGWILMFQSLDGLHIMLMNGIIIIHLSEFNFNLALNSIEFNFNLALNTIEFSIRVTFCYFFVCLENKCECK